MLPKAFSSLGVAIAAVVLVIAACGGGVAATTSPIANGSQVASTTGPSAAFPSSQPTGAPTAASSAGPTLKPTVEGVQNGRIAYGVRATDGIFNIFSALPDGTGQIQLTTGTDNRLCAAYSADGTKMAYCGDAGGSFEIWTMQADGTGQKQLTHLAGRSLFPDFSPDGKQIAFAGIVGADSHTDIYVVDATTGEGLVALTTCKDKAMGCTNDYPTWSPDGKRIAFVHADDYTGETPVNEQVWIMDADGGNQHALTTGATPKDQLPGWSPDGKQIVYVSGGRDSEGIWVMATDGSAQVQLSGCAPGEASPCADGDDFAPVWSPDGSRIAFLRAFGAVGANDRPVYVMDADGTDQRRLMEGTILQAAPAWQALRK